MGNKTIISIIILIIVVLSIVLIYYIDEAPSGDYSGNMELKVYSEEPRNLSKIIGEVETSPYYEGYDSKTLDWMKSLGNKAVFSGNGTLVIMDFNDANKIPSQYVTEVI